jgi:hypothetical protein
MIQNRKELHESSTAELRWYALSRFASIPCVAAQLICAGCGAEIVTASHRKEDDSSRKKKGAGKPAPSEGNALV